MLSRTGERSASIPRMEILEDRVLMCGDPPLWTYLYGAVRNWPNGFLFRQIRQPGFGL